MPLGRELFWLASEVPATAGHSFLGGIAGVVFGFFFADDFFFLGFLEGAHFFFGFVGTFFDEGFGEFGFVFGGFGRDAEAGAVGGFIPGFKKSEAGGDDLRGHGEIAERIFGQGFIQLVRDGGELGCEIGRGGGR